MELARTRPELIRKFKKYVEDGRIEIVSGSYAQPFLFLNLGESVIRQLHVGKQVVKDVFDYDVVTYASQEPCFTSQLPQILSGLEYKYCALKNMWCLFGNPPSINEAKVWWIGPDGSVIETSPKYSVQFMKTRNRLLEALISLTTQDQFIQIPIITAVQCKDGEVYVRVYQP